MGNGSLILEIFEFSLKYIVSLTGWSQCDCESESYDPIHDPIHEVWDRLYLSPQNPNFMRGSIPAIGGAEVR